MGFKSCGVGGTVLGLGVVEFSGGFSVGSAEGTRKNKVDKASTTSGHRKSGSKSLEGDVGC